VPPSTAARGDQRRSTTKTPSLTLAHPRLPLACLAAALLLVCTTAPAQAQRCFTQNGQTICCDNSGNCYNR